MTRNEAVLTVLLRHHNACDERDFADDASERLLSREELISKARALVDHPLSRMRNYILDALRSQITDGHVIEDEARGAHPLLATKPHHGYRLTEDGLTFANQLNLDA